MPTTINTLTGIVDFQPDHVVDHPIVGRYLKVVPEGTKSLVPGMFKPGTVEEFDELNANAFAAENHDEEPITPIDPLIDNKDIAPKEDEAK